MSPIDPQQDAPAELAALYLSGALEPAERRRVEQALDSGDPALVDPALVDAVRRLADGVIALGEVAGSVEPTPDVRMRILAAAAASSSAGREQIWRNWHGDAESAAAQAGLFTLRGNDGAWEQTGVPGVEVRKLFVDRAANRMTAMFRMAPGTSYPEHHHDGHEECYVLHGDLHVGEEFVMNAGDYQRAEAHSPHDRQWTKGGCVLLVSTSLSDEMHDEE